MVAKIRYQKLATPIGELLIAADSRALKEIYWARRGKAVSPDPGWEPGTNRVLTRAARQLREYFSGERSRFELPVDPAGTEFQRRVWSALQKIPFGKTVSYGELARRIGKPTASRAVGAANGANPIPIVIPCHRVIGANGALTGFGGGLDVKEQLLQLESPLFGKSDVD